MHPARAPAIPPHSQILEHKHTLYEQLSRPREVAAVAYYCCAHSSGPLVRSCCPWGPRRNRDEIFCEGVLAHVSRSFATLIMELPPALRRSVMVFYLVLRGLDTVEDDMEAFAGAPGEKLRHLRAFHTYLAQPEWCLRGVGQGRERELLERFPALLRVYARLPPAHAAVIRDVAQQMGEGMACFAERNLAEGTRDTEDYDLYCVSFNANHPAHQKSTPPKNKPEPKPYHLLNSTMWRGLWATGSRGCGTWRAWRAPGWPASTCARRTTWASSCKRRT
jgi:hypothetical protein